MDTLNQYLVIGREVFKANPEYIRMLIQMATESLFCKEPSITINNAEGAILIQLLFQVFSGTQAMDVFYEDLM